MNIIYGLYCDHCVVPTIQYVGQTSKGIQHRFAQHLNSKGLRTLCHAWIQKHGKENIRYIIIEECDTSDILDEREIFWISFYNTKHSKDNPKGKNLTEGGKSKRGYVTSPETREKIAAAHRGVPETLEARQAMSKAQTGKKHGPRSEHVKDKISKSLKGRTRPEEARKNISKSLTGRTVSPEHAVKNRKASHIRWHTNRGIVKHDCEFCA